ncbi:uncharacterized protein LOC117179828 [Belonocnema kinseyi]|uniref:uncharacterized protein LOC117179828 n=1 Tax=Belonocnema kinseyi TaxID=2817044 RepID=UPI00143D5FB8|nr:uncharacterized protein LOC117179828 [Belonocnema kinseyi]
MSQPWVKRCDIKYCKNNKFSQRDAPTVHPTPRCPQLFQKWDQQVRCTGTRLPRNGRLCEKHFDPDDIMEFGCSKKVKQASNTIVTESVKIRVLVNGAIPTRFDDEIAEYLRQKELQGDTGEIDESQFIPVEAEEVPVNPKRPRRPPIKGLPIIASNIVLQAPLQKKVEEKIKSAEELLFAKIYTGQIEPRLPSRSWNIHNCQLPEKGFVFSEIAPLSSDNSVPPLFRKSVFFDGNFNMRVYLVGKYFPNVEFNKPKTIRDVEELLSNINAIKLCEGGPRLADKTFKLAYKDERMSRWRHINCELRLKRGSICKFCSDLCRHPAVFSNLEEKVKPQEMQKINQEEEIEDMEIYETEYLDD